MKRLLSFLLSALLCVTTQSAPTTVIGNNLGISGSGLDTKVVFQAQSNLSIHGVTNTLAGVSTSVVPTNGLWSVDLMPGDYRIFIGAYTNLIRVPSTNDVQQFNDLLAYPRTYTFTNDVNHTVKVSATDTEANFLASKIVAGDNITIDHNDIGSVETLTINSTGGGPDGTVTSVDIVPNTGFTATGGPITDSGTFEIGTDVNGIIYGVGGGLAEVTIGSGLSFGGGTLSATDSGGTVTSVALSMPGGFTVAAGSPITDAGTIEVETDLNGIVTANGSTFDVLTIGTGLDFDGTTLTVNGDVGVQSVGITVPTGLSVTGSPITGSGDLGITTALDGIVRANGTGFDIVTIGSGLTYDGTTLEANASGGSVTSVAMTVPTGLSIAGSPVTTSGTLALTTALDGIVKGNGSGLGTITVGSGLTYDGTTLAATAAGSGTVTSVAFTAPTGFSVTGSPITGAGTIGLTTALNGILKGTGSAFGTVVVGSGLAYDGTTLSASGSGGTVTSVGLTMPSGLSVSGSPVTGSGTLAVTTSLNGIVRGTGSGLSTVTIGSGLSYAGGTLSSTASGGTVTSVAMTVPGGLSVSGSPITGSGTLALTTTLNGIVKGNGSALSAATIGGNLSYDGTTLNTATALNLASIVITNSVDGWNTNHSGTSITLNWNGRPNNRVEPAGDLTVAFSNTPTDTNRTRVIYLRVTPTSPPISVTWPSNLQNATNWYSGAVPATISSKTLFTFEADGSQIIGTSTP